MVVKSELRATHMYRIQNGLRKHDGFFSTMPTRVLSHELKGVAGIYLSHLLVGVEGWLYKSSLIRGST